LKTLAGLFGQFLKLGEQAGLVKVGHVALDGTRTEKSFTGPESRILKTRDGFVEGYNAQAAVDATAQGSSRHMKCRTIAGREHSMRWPGHLG
jgi:hypothetical protein